MSSLVDSFEKAVVKLRRRRISKNLFDKYEGRVQHGPFTGLQLDRKNNVSKGQLALKVFGLYESVVMEAIAAAGPFGDLINIGACDGYFSLGLLRAGLVKRSICFETFIRRQETIRRLAANNNLADQVIVLGEADERIGEMIAEHNFEPQDSLVICDIEGAEFQLLTPSFLNQLAGSTMVIELHDRVVNPQSQHDRQQLIQRLPAGYQHKLLKWQPACLDGIGDLAELSDNDRALATSEGRKKPGEWLFAWRATNFTS